MGPSNLRTDAADSRQAILFRLERICREFHVDSLLPQLRAGEEVLREHGVVDVAVLGQFKAGKSSFLNALIGRDVLPVNVLPATAVITRIGDGPAERALVRYLAGRVDEIPLEDLPEFVTEQRNPGNASDRPSARGDVRGDRQPQDPILDRRMPAIPGSGAPRRRNRGKGAGGASGGPGARSP